MKLDISPEALPLLENDDTSMRYVQTFLDLGLPVEVTVKDGVLHIQAGKQNDE
jgi:hypothetical protein